MDQEIQPERLAAIQDGVSGLAERHGINIGQLSQIINAMNQQAIESQLTNGLPATGPAETGASDNDATDLYREYILSGRHEWGSTLFWDEYRKLDRKKGITLRISTAELIAGIEDDADRIKGRLRFLKAFLEKSEYPARNYVTITGSEEEKTHLVGLEANVFASGVKFEVE